LALQAPLLRLRPEPLPQLIPDPPSREALDEALHRYLDRVLERNQTTNLTAIRDPAMAWERLILASLALLDAHDFEGTERVVDVGSGAGLPGIPLKLALPGLRLTLIESDLRKAEFLEDVVAEMSLEDVTVEARRAEEVGRDPEHRETYDVAVTRAAAKAPVAAEYCLPLVRNGGVLLAQARMADWKAAGRALGHLGGRISGEVGGVVIVAKVRDTRAEYPRRVGVPTKKPL
jgi:16S rRNA (guanine527-N7)-methyltransferase